MFLMAQYSTSLGTMAVKDLIFNRAAVRPATAEEINTYSFPNQINSKGTDLVTNGTALLGNNYNFSTSFDFNGADAPTGASGSFVSKTGAQGSHAIEEFIPFDPAKKYRFSFQIRQTVPGAVSKAYGYLAPYDASNNSIAPSNYMWVTGTQTTLAQALNPGDLTVKLTSAANFWGQTGKAATTNTHYRSIIWWDYVDPFGKAWPIESYSRNTSGYDFWSDGGVDLATNTITLRVPYAGPAKAAGTPLSNGSSGGALVYMPSLQNLTIPETWTPYADTFSAGIMASAGGTAGVAASWVQGMPPGTAKVKVGWLLNYAPTSGKHAVAAVSLSDAAAAQSTADASSKTYIQSATPVGRTQDLWIDTTGGNNTPKRWNGSAWVAVTDKAATDAAAAATASSMTYIQSTTPTGRSQDLWIDTTAGANTPKRWNGSAWVAVTDQNAIAAAQTYTDGKFAATLKNSVIEYASNASETVTPTTGWSTTAPARTPGTFIWYRTVITFGDNTTNTSSAALLTGNTGATGATGATGSQGPQGNTGAAGTNGVSITGITPYFYQVSPANGTAPTVTTPTAATPGAGWTTTEPAFVKDTALYRTERIAYSNSTYSYTSVYRSSAYDAAATAQATADGKNNILRSTSDATGANFANGDLWWKLDVNGNVIKQWKFVTGTGWVVETLMDGVLGSLNANKIVAGTTFTQDLFVKSTFTLGDVSTPGVIKSYNYVLNTTGFSLSSAGLQINNGDIDAKTLRANSSFVTNLFIGAGGAIQSTGYNPGVTGFKLSNTGLVVEGAGNTISASAMKAGTITATTINIGATGVLNIDSTGVVKSNNYAAGTTGYQLSNTGLEINDGSIDAKVMKTNTAFITDLIMGRSADALGTIRSFDYNSGVAGWKIGKGLFEVNGGTIKAAALQLQDSDNIVLPPYADFEFTSTFYSTSMLSPANVTKTIVNTGARFSSQFMQARATTAAAFDLYLGSSTTDYNTSVEPSTTYIMSAWLKTGATASTATLKVKLSNGTILTAATQALGASGAWQRVSGTFAVPAGITTLVPIVGSTTATIGAGVDIDGIQIERQMAGLTTPSPWTPPGTTFADGGMIRTGEIRSTTNVTVNGVSQPAWSINMSGGAQFGNANVRGSIVVGPAGADTDAGQSFIASGNYVQDTTGWKMSSSGDLEAASGKIRGNAIVDGTLTGNKIVAKTLTSDLIALGILKTNLVNDASFEESYTMGVNNSTTNVLGNLEQWRTLPLSAGGTVTRLGGVARSGNMAVAIYSPAGQTNGIYSNVFPVTPGVTYKLTFYGAATGVGTPTTDLNIWEGTTQTGINSSNSVTPIIADDGTGWTVPPLSAGNPVVTPSDYVKYEAEFTPALAWCVIRFRNISPLSNSTYIIDDVSVVQMGIGGGSEITAAGLRLFGDDGVESGAFVSNRPNYFTVSSGGDVVAAIDGDGAITGTSVKSASDFWNPEGPLLGRMDNIFSNLPYTDDPGRNYETDPRGYLEGVSGNNVAFCSFGTGNFSSTGLVSTGSGQAYQLLYQFNADIYPYRVYELNVGNILATAAAGVAIGLLVRFTTNGTDPTASSPIFTRAYVIGGGVGFVSLACNRTFWTNTTGANGVNTDYRFLVQLMNLGTSGTVTLTSMPTTEGHTASIKDIGHVQATDYQIINQVVQPATTPPAQPVTKKTYVQTWTANTTGTPIMQTRRGTSAFGNNTVNTAAPSGYHLAGYYSSSNGNQYTYIAFLTNGSLGQPITTAISGATINKVELYVKNATFYAASGGSQRFSMTTLGSIPSGGTSTTVGNAYTGNIAFTTGQGKWVTLPLSGVNGAAATLTGGGRVAIIGPGPSNSNTYYSKWNDHLGTGAPQLRITYTK
jgi:hypothetical protein